MWNAVRNESREFIWLASMVSGLSLLGVGLAVGLALLLVGIP
jgi:F0F1-type ATP synthase membrane subunit c/vacuolar-type H+-ATPase subunit K